MVKWPILVLPVRAYVFVCNVINVVRLILRSWKKLVYTLNRMICCMKWNGKAIASRQANNFITLAGKTKCKVP